MHRYSHNSIITGLLFSLMLLSSCTKEREQSQLHGAARIDGGQPEIGAGPAAVNSMLSETRVLSTVENLVMLPAESQSQNHSPSGAVVFSQLGRGVAYIANVGDKQRVVHNGKPGTLHDRISYLTISPDGQRVSYRCMLANKQQLVSDGIARQIYDNVRDMEYSPDSRQISYLTQIGGTGSVVVDDRALETGPAFGHKFFSADSGKFVYTIRPGGLGLARLVILDLKSGDRASKELVDIPFAVNRETGRIAAAIQEGEKQRVIDFAINSPEKINASGLYDIVYLISLGYDGKTVAFAAARGNGRYLVVNGKEERLPDNLAFNDAPVIRPDLRGAGIILSTLERNNRRDVLHQGGVNDVLTGKFYKKLKDLVYSRTDGTAAVVAKEDEQWFVLVNGKKGPSFDMVVTPNFSPDGRWLVYRARKGDRRLVVVADAAGKEHRPHSEYEMVFPALFTADGKSVAYGVKDGNQLIWKVEKLP